MATLCRDHRDRWGSLVVEQLCIAGFGGWFDRFGGWVESFELDSCVGRGELSVHVGAGFIAALLPGRDFTRKFVAVWDAAVEALATQDSQFDLGPAFIEQPQPTALFGGVMDFQFVDQAASFFGGEGRVQRSGFVSVEVVLDEHDLFRVGVHHLDQMRNGVGVVDHSALVCHERCSATFPGGVQQEDVGGSVANVLVVGNSLRVFRSRFQRRSRVIDELFAGFVKADQGACRIGGAVVDVQGFFPLTDELGVGLGGG